mmetsp:Transcript_21312/g.42677  ORF Transcript_21312/g.42677 Transcript_21312/m.42677 type:complete len:126 (+) Transcript_21312:204-581(+)
MERLTGSPYVGEVHGFCGNSVVNEFGAASGRDWRHLKVAVGDRLRRAAQAAAGVADVHGLDFSAGQEGKRAPVAPAVVHLDVKPGNFIFTSGDTMKLRDFNLAYFLEASVATGTCETRRSWIATS